MAEKIDNTSFETTHQQDIVIPEKYKEIFGFEEFYEKFQRLTDIHKQQISQVFQSQINNSAFFEYVEQDLFGVSEIDNAQILFLQKKYGSGINRKEQEKTEDNDKVKEEINLHIDTIFNNILYKDILDSALRATPYKSKSKVIEGVYKELQEAAYKNDVKEGKVDDSGKPTPESNFAQLNVRLQRLSDLGVINNFESTLQIVTQNPANPTSLNGQEAARIGMDTSTYQVTQTDGDTVQYGDQVIDFGEKPPVKYIESENGEWKLKSTELDFSRNTKLYKERDELTKEIQDIDTKREPLQSEISRAEGQLGKLASLDLQSVVAREQLAEHFAHIMPRTGIVEQIEHMDGLQGNELDTAIVVLKNKIGTFLKERIGELQNNQNKFQGRKETAEERIRQINTEIETQEADFRDKVREKDEKTRKVSLFLQEIGLDSIPQSSIEQIFSMISESNPITIAGNTITGINLQTFQFEGTFTPPLGDGGVDNINSKKLFTKLINKMITGGGSEPIEITGSGVMVFKKDGVIIEKTQYQNYIKSQLDLGFQIRFQSNIFGSQSKEVQ